MIETISKLAYICKKILNDAGLTPLEVAKGFNLIFSIKNKGLELKSCAVKTRPYGL